VGKKGIENGEFKENSMKYLLFEVFV